MTDAHPVADRIALDYAEHVDWLARSARDDAERHRGLAEDLVRPTDTVLVDIGCGAAGMAAALERRAPGARVIAIDADPAVVDAARRAAEAAGRRIEFATGDIEAGAEALLTVLGEPADLVWAGHVVHHAADQQAALDSLARVLGPTGRLALAEGGLGPRHLPWDLGVGLPGLQARMEVAAGHRARAENAERGAVAMPYGWNTALRRAGFARVETRNAFVDRPAPLSGTDLDTALADLSARFGWFADFLSADDHRTWRRLLDPADPAWLGHREDLFHLEIRSVHIGYV